MKEKDLPLVSVIIPTYKNRGCLDRAIDSVLTQNYNNLEIIIVDDNTEGDAWRKETESLMGRYSDPRIIYLKHKININGAAARNTGINVSQGELIAFLDDDDYFLPDKITKQVEFLDVHPEYDAVYCQGLNNGVTIAQHLKEGNLSRDILLLQGYMDTPSLMFRSRVIKGMKGFDESFRRHQDYEILLRFFKRGHKIGVIQEPLYVKGQNKGENILKGDNYEKLKIYFFDKFDSYIKELNREAKGFSRHVYALHFSSVFITYIKQKDKQNALRIFNSYFWSSPLYFSKPILKSIGLRAKKIFFMKHKS